MQETRVRWPDGYEETMREFFQAPTHEELRTKMDGRLEELKAEATVLESRRRKVEINKRCPCGSGRKFKNCCLSKVR